MTSFIRESFSLMMMLSNLMVSPHSPHFSFASLKYSLWSMLLLSDEIVTILLLTFSFTHCSYKYRKPSQNLKYLPHPEYPSQFIDESITGFCPSFLYFVTTTEVLSWFIELCSRTRTRIDRTYKTRWIRECAISFPSSKLNNKKFFVSSNPWKALKAFFSTLLWNFSNFPIIKSMMWWCKYLLQRWLNGYDYTKRNKRCFSLPNIAMHFTK